MWGPGKAEGTKLVSSETLCCYTGRLSSAIESAVNVGNKCQVSHLFNVHCFSLGFSVGADHATN